MELSNGKHSNFHKAFAHICGDCNHRSVSNFFRNTDTARLDNEWLSSKLERDLGIPDNQRLPCHESVFPSDLRQITQNILKAF
jgi:hypothetical protein